MLKKLISKGFLPVCLFLYAFSVIHTLNVLKAGGICVVACKFLFCVGMYDMNGVVLGAQKYVPLDARDTVSVFGGRFNASAGPGFGFYDLYVCTDASPDCDLWPGQTNIVESNSCADCELLHSFDNHLCYEFGG